MRVGDTLSQTPCWLHDLLTGWLVKQSIQHCRQQGIFTAWIEKVVHADARLFVLAVAVGACVVVQ
jgi:hypothetical protein